MIKNIKLNLPRLNIGLRAPTLKTKVQMPKVQSTQEKRRLREMGNQTITDISDKMKKHGW